MLLLLVAIAGELSYLVYVQSQRASNETVVPQIGNTVKEIQDPRVREQRRIQAAVRAYQVNEKKLPSSLQDLVPTYIDKIPTDPKTGQPFTYKTQDNEFFVGTDADEPVSSATKPPVTISSETPASQANNRESSNKKQNENIKKETVLAAIATDPNAGWVYDPVGKRDPFLPTDLVIGPIVDENAPVLCQFALNQLKLTAVLEGFSPTRAIVETLDGKGHMVQPGMKMGLACGEIVTIDKQRIVILETEVDPFDPINGKKKQKQVELSLRTPEKVNPVGSR